MLNMNKSSKSAVNLKYFVNIDTAFASKHSSCAHIQVGPLWVGVAGLVLSVQMPEWDGQGRVGLLTKPQRVRRKGGVQRRRRGGGGKTGGKRRVVQNHLRAVGGGRIELRDGAYIKRRI